MTISLVESLPPRAEKIQPPKPPVDVLDDGACVLTGGGGI